MLDNLDKTLLSKRIDEFTRLKKISEKNINFFMEELKVLPSEEVYKKYFFHKKKHNIIDQTITNLEYLERIFHFFKLQEIVIATSNESKLNEIKRIIPNIQSLKNAKDIEEVDGTLDEVILYKAKDAKKENNIGNGTSIIVEDTIIRNLDTGKDITDIKWNVDSLVEGTNVEWITSLALNDGINIYVFRGTQKGVVTKERGDQGFAFDPYFIPIELYQKENEQYSNNTLGELDKIGLKDKFSARTKALENLSNFKLEMAISLVDIPNWTKSYQNEKEFTVTFNDEFFQNIFVLNENNQKTFKYLNEFVDVMEELNIDYMDIEKMKTLIKENKEIFVCLDLYNLNIFDQKQLIIEENKEDLEKQQEEFRSLNLDL